MYISYVLGLAEGLAEGVAGGCHPDWVTWALRPFLSLRCHLGSVEGGGMMKEEMKLSRQIRDVRMVI